MRFRRPYIIEAARRRRPAVWVYILSAVLAALWLVPQALDRRVDAGEDLIGEKLFEVFAHDPAAVWSGEYWRLLTATFLHGNFLHLAFNVFGLMILGPAVERWLGGMRFLLYYFVGGIVGSLFFQASSGLEVEVGASGAILALLGVFSVGAYARPGRDGPILPRRFWTFILLAVPILFLEGPIVGALFSLLGYEGIGVAVSAHLGGFFGGLLLTLFHVHRVAARETEHEATASRNRLRAHASLGALGALAIAVGVYGLVWPFGNWGWHVFVAKQELERKAPVDSIRDELSTALDLGGKRVALPAIVSVLAQAGELEAAIHYWREVEAPFLIREQIGYVILFGALWKEGRFEDGDKILDELIALADEELARNRSPEILNSAAWFRAERNRDLDRALAYAREAWAMDDGSAIENTLGWVHVLRGEWKEGLDHLENAAKRDPSGPHFLYLALAYLRMQADDNARQYAALARQKGVHLEHERVLLQNLERTLAPPKEPQAPDGVHVIESPRKPF